MDDDASLIPRAAAGDRAAFRALVERHRTMVYRVASVDDEAVNAVDTFADAAPGPEDRAYGGELGHVLRSEIERLPPRQRLIFTMRHFEELKLSEIADALDLAEGTVKRQLHAAVHRLRGALRSSLSVRTAAERPRRLRTGELI
jgi:RNA polymerase sigma-70 factor, ECF subfamily